MLKALLLNNDPNPNSNHMDDIRKLHVEIDIPNLLMYPVNFNFTETPNQMNDINNFPDSFASEVFERILQSSNASLFNFMDARF